MLGPRASRVFSTPQSSGCGPPLAVGTNWIRVSAASKVVGCHELAPAAERPVALRGAHLTREPCHCQLGPLAGDSAGR